MSKEIRHDAYESNKPYIPDVMNPEKEIEPYSAVAIYSGVGSRKSTWMNKYIEEKFMNEDKLSLVLTSRRIKVDQELDGYKDKEELPPFTRYIGFGGNVKLDELNFWRYAFGYYSEIDSKYDPYMRKMADGTYEYWGNIYTTSAAIGHWFKKLYESAYPLHLYSKYDPLNMFDYIYIDEIHNLVTDAGYSDAPFHIYCMLKRYAENRENYKCKHIIFMTATPNCVDGILKTLFPDLHVVDYLNVCAKLVPAKIKLLSHDIARRRIVNQVNKGKNVIYIYNGEILFISKSIKGTNLSEEIVVTLFSDKEKRALMAKKEPENYERMMEVFASIAKNGRIPDEIKLTLATSALREGFGIESPVDYMYVDSHIESDVIQMSGRVRKGGHELIVVVDSPEFYTSDKFEMEKISQKLENEALASINHEFATIEDDAKRVWFIENVIEQSDKKIKNQQHPYIRFNYYTGEFEYYYLREVFINYAQMSFDKWHNFKDYGYTNFADIVREWFGEGVKVDNYKTKKQLSYKYLREIAKIKICDKDKIYKYDINKINKMISDLQMIWGDKYKSINGLLKQFSEYECVRYGKNKEYRIFVDKRNIGEKQENDKIQE